MTIRGANEVGVLPAQNVGAAAVFIRDAPADCKDASALDEADRDYAGDGTSDVGPFSLRLKAENHAESATRLRPVPLRRAVPRSGRMEWCFEGHRESCALPRSSDLRPFVDSVHAFGLVVRAV